MQVDKLGNMENPIRGRKELLNLSRRRRVVSGIFLSNAIVKPRNGRVGWVHQCECR